MELNKLAVLCLLVSASLLSASVTAGRYKNRPINLVTEKEDVIAKNTEEAGMGEQIVLHGRGERILIARTNDYGSFDRAPTFSRPRFKRIPN